MAIMCWYVTRSHLDANWHYYSSRIQNNPLHDFSSNSPMFFVVFQCVQCNIACKRITKPIAMSMIIVVFANDCEGGWYTQSDTKLFFIREVDYYTETARVKIFFYRCNYLCCAPIANEMTRNLIECVVLRGCLWFIVKAYKFRSRVND